MPPDVSVQLESSKNVLVTFMMTSALTSQQTENVVSYTQFVHNNTGLAVHHVVYTVNDCTDKCFPTPAIKPHHSGEQNRVLSDFLDVLY